ncbi:hypothetical protein NQ314_008823 [Rhamnusium bicolor]|uniref:CCHC-type domain-containing protein n=1 Tax=Rhamnusium bicolor TaxID=1586634 RepID=A0AAV8Y5F8_9CUCU|nr:hypothetical protein NQ314_008823 [Rhamnusium bicolor]
MDTLKRRYDNNRKTIYNHIQAFLDIPATNHDSFNSLKYLTDTVECLKSLGQPVESWHAILVTIVTSKLDIHTITEWENILNNKSNNQIIPTLDEFLKFLQNKLNTLETVDHIKLFEHNKTKPILNVNSRSTKSFAVTNVSRSRSHCKGEHYIQFCNEFLKLSVNDRSKLAKELKLCLNCLRQGHFLPNCMSQSTCRKCKKRHHTLLHLSSLPSISEANNKMETNVVANAAAAQ